MNATDIRPSRLGPYVALECSSGPVSTMPGSRLRLAPGDAKCDDHPEANAAFRVQGETDSMGCEYHHLCASCTDAALLTDMIPKSGFCEWHKGEGQDLRPFRDMDEGMSGRLYITCMSCRDKVHAEAAAEMADRGDDYDWYEDDLYQDEVCYPLDPDPFGFENDMDRLLMNHPLPAEAMLAFDEEFGIEVTQATRMALARERSLHNLAV